MGLFRAIPVVCALLCGSLAFGQATQLGTQTVNGTYTSYPLADLGIFRQARVQAASSSLSGTRNWEFYEAPFDYDPAWRPYTGGLILTSFNQTIPPVGGTASALFNTGFGGSAGLMPAITAGRYYTFNVTEYSTPGVPANEYMGVLETAFNPVSITAVAQTPAAGAVYPETSVYVTVTTSAAPSAGEYVYVRYSTTFNFVTSTLLTVAMTGTTGTVEIPCQASGTSIYYYVYTSNRTSAAILADAGTYGQVAHDVSTLSLNNNGGPNYSYTVLPSIGFCGDYYVPSVCYPTIASFVTALNAGTVSCDVVCHVATGHTETAPAGGINLTQTGTAANTITFIRDGVGANPIIYAPVGTVSITATATVSDGVFSLNGSDHITIDGIDIVDNNASGAAMMEYGYGLFKASATDGCQNNVIRNCNITLNQDNHWTGAPLNFEFGSTGVMLRNSSRTALTTLLTITTASGRSDNNQFYGNTISDMLYGFVFAGYNDVTSPYSFYDQGNSIGISGSGNTIQQFGNDNTVGISRAAGVYTIYQNNIIVTDNVINSSPAGLEPHANTLYGIFISSPVTGSYSQTVSVTNNDISLLRSEVSSRMVGIKVGNSSAGATLVTVSGNNIHDCTFYNDPLTPVTTPSGDFYGIDVGFNAVTVNITDNIIQDNVLNTSTTQVQYLIFNNTTGANITVTGNQMLNNYKTISSPSGVYYGYYSASSSATGTQTFSDNVIDGFGIPSIQFGSACGVRISTGLGQTKLVYNNTIANMTGGTSVSTMYNCGMYIDGMTTGSEIYGNSLSNFSGGNLISGIHLASAAVMNTTNNLSYNCYNNTISGISSTSGVQGPMGISAYMPTSGSGAMSFFNNSITDLTSTSTSAGYIYGIYITGGTTGAPLTFYGNTIHDLQHTGVTATSMAVSGILVGSGPQILTVFGNSISDISNTGTTGISIGLNLQNTNSVNIYNNFIQRIFSTASGNTLAVQGILAAGSGATWNVRYNTIALGYGTPLSSTGSNFGFTGMQFPTTGVTFNSDNNIVYVNGTANGVGLGSCLRGATGTAYVVPASFSGSNNNYYFINNATWNYIYTEGTANTGNVNGYAYGGAFTDAVRNLNNDECFNIVGPGTGLYKTFMAPAESNSFFDVPPFAGGAVYPDNLKLIPGAVTYAESNAQVIPGITIDYEGDVRSGTTPDIGADEGAFLPQVEDCYLLPLELLSFTGWNSGTYNELHWITATEFNTSHFEIERSTDGITFYPIGMTGAAGFTVAPEEYVFIDDAPLTGNNYYRLRMVDLDGAYEYSNIVLITLQGVSSNILSVSPNPVEDVLHVTVQLPNAARVELYLTDMLGRKVLAQTFAFEAGSQVLDLDVRLLAPAAYMLTVTGTSGVLDAVKVLKQ